MMEVLPRPISTSARSLLQWLKPQDPSRSILPFIPRPLKWLFLLILLINARALPLAWHIRVFRPGFYVRLYHSFRDLIDSPSARVTRLARICPVGMDPFTSETVFRTRATPDACDYNMHLSNSSYAMTHDMVRFKYVLEYFPMMLLGDRAWFAVGGTHYVFTREIPFNSPYEIRLSVVTWDQKWFYLVARYVTYPSKSKSNSQSNSKQPLLADGSAYALGPPPALTSPANTAVPSPALSPAPTQPSLGVQLPSGAILHCTAVSRICCKAGRITVPPSISLVCAGFGISPSRFAEIHSWRFEDNGKRLKDFCAGGWRNVPEGERWWDEALGGDIEKKRLEGLKGLAAVVGVPVFAPAES